MDWSNERYVRLYTRDTTTWKRLGWDGQCVLMQLLRKVDRAGTLELSGLEAWEAVMLHIGSTEDVARRGVEALLRTETAVIAEGRLIFPSFIEAQECSKSDKQRQRESRERRALAGLKYPPVSRNVTERHERSRDDHGPSRADQAYPQNAPGEASGLDGQQTVRPCENPGAVTKRDAMQSQNVTERHEQSQPVTFGHSVLCSAVQYSAEQYSAEQEPSLRECSFAGAHAHTREEPTAVEIRTRFAALFEARFGDLPYMGGGEVVATFPARVVASAQKRGVPWGELMAQAFERWASQPRDKVAKNAPYASFAGQWGSLLDELGGGQSELDRVALEASEALKAGDSERYRRLNDRVRQLRGLAENARDGAKKAPEAPGPSQHTSAPTTGVLGPLVGAQRGLSGVTRASGKGVG